jgi:hypothetical protein
MPSSYQECNSTNYSFQFCSQRAFFINAARNLIFDTSHSYRRISPCAAIGRQWPSDQNGRNISGSIVRVIYDAGNVRALDNCRSFWTNTAYEMEFSIQLFSHEYASISQYYLAVFSII